MKCCLLMSLLLGSIPGFCLAQDTAYKALRAVGTSKGEKSLNEIVEISGKAGHSQPTDWKVTLSDPAARGGLREYHIVANQISSERAPLRSDSGGSPPIDLANLNLDSDGAFRAAEREAQRNHVGFDSVNYHLAAGPNGKPIWKLNLVDVNQNPVGTVRIAADTGNLIGGGGWVQNGTITHSNRTVEESQPPSPPPPQYSNSTSNHQGPAPLDYRQMPQQEEPQPPPPTADDSRTYTTNRPDESSAHGSAVHEELHSFKDQMTDIHRNWTHQTKNFFRNIGDWIHDKVGGSSGESRQYDERNYQRQQPPPATSDQYNTPVQPVPQQ